MRERGERQRREGEDNKRRKEKRENEQRREKRGEIGDLSLSLV